MTATNHAVTGAVIAMVVKQPALALPLAFLSHFLLDAIPHFGIHEDDVLKRNTHRLFRIVVGVDTLVLLSMFVFLPWFAHQSVAWGVVLGAMLTAIIPDTVWIYRFVHERRTNVVRPHGRFARLHQRIQWSEKPWGLWVEAAWLIAALAVVSRVVA